jgi:hypothetical protein
MDASGTCFNLNSGVPINDEVDLGIQMIGVFNDAWQACGVAMDKYLQKGINVNWYDFLFFLMRWNMGLKGFAL